MSTWSRARSDPRTRKRIMSRPNGAGGSNMPPQPPPIPNENQNPPQNPNQAPMQMPYIPLNLMNAMQGSDPLHLQAINNFLQQAFHMLPPKPNQQTQVTIVNTQSEKPRHNPNNQTAHAFIHEVNSYFVIQNIRADKYTLVFRSHHTYNRGLAGYDRRFHCEV